MTKCYERASLLSARILRRSELTRISCEIAAYEQEVKGRTKDPKTLPLLKAARKLANMGDIERGWRYLQTARRRELAAPNNADAVRAAAIALRAEAEEKLTSWRKEAVRKLLEDSPKPPDAAQVCEAAWIRDEHSNNQAYKAGLFRTTTTWLVLWLLGATILLAWICCQGDYLRGALAKPNPENPDAKALVTVAVFGLLGAVISAITKTLSNSAASARIPEVTSSFRGAVLRVLVGPVSAIVLYFVMQSNLGPKILGEGGQGYIVLVAAFAAGFSERLVTRFLDSLGERSSK